MAAIYSKSRADLAAALPLISRAAEAMSGPGAAAPAASDRPLAAAAGSDLLDSGAAAAQNLNLNHDAANSSAAAAMAAASSWNGALAAGEADAAVGNLEARIQEEVRASFARRCSRPILRSVCNYFFLIRRGKQLQARA